MQHLGRRRFVSQSALVGLLKEIRDSELPAHISRPTLKRARDKDVMVTNRFGSVLGQLNVDGVDVHFLHPIAFLQHCVDECPPFADYFVNMLDSLHPSSPLSPLSLVVYSDEVSPGNQLKHDNKRKLQTIYWSIKELGPAALSAEHFWFVLTTIRSNEVSNIVGGMSALMARCLLLFFEDPNNLATSGVNIRFPDGSFRSLFCTIGIMVSDEGALKSALDMKGASGTKPCMLCQNIVRMHQPIHNHDATGFLQPISEVDVRKYAVYTDTHIAEIIQKLEESELTMNKGDFQRLQQATGFNLNRRGILSSLALRPVFKPISALMYDWMHVYLVGGVFNSEVGCLLDELGREAHILHTNIHTYFQDFIWPHWLKGASGIKVFEKRSAGSTDLKCSASEGLSSYKLLRLFLKDEIMPTANNRLQQCCNSFFLLCEVLDLLVRVSRGTTSHIELHNSIVRHLELFKATYGANEFFPKMHWSTHLGMMLERHGTLISCFVHERKHKEVKRFGNHLSNTSASFEKSILQEVAYTQLHTLMKPENVPFPTAHLVEPIYTASDSLLQALISILGPNITDKVITTSRVVKFAGLQQTCVGDVVLFVSDDATGVGKVEFNASIDSHCVTCVCQWNALGRNRFDTNECQYVLVDSSSIKDVLIYSQVGPAVRVAP